MIAPAWLCTIGKTYWRLLEPMVDTTDNAKASLLAVLCDHYATYRIASKQLREEGHTVPTLSGGVKPHPMASAKLSASDHIMKLSKLLELSGKAKEVETVDELDALLG